MIDGYPLLWSHRQGQARETEVTITHYCCWICDQRATHVMTRPGSITLHACDHHTRIDRDEAISRGWTVEAVRRREETGGPSLDDICLI